MDGLKNVIGRRVEREEECGLRANRMCGIVTRFQRPSGDAGRSSTSTRRGSKGPRAGLASVPGSLRVERSLAYTRPGVEPRLAGAPSVKREPRPDG